MLPQPVRLYEAFGRTGGAMEFLNPCRTQAGYQKAAKSGGKGNGSDQRSIQTRHGIGEE